MPARERYCVIRFSVRARDDLYLLTSARQSEEEGNIYEPEEDEDDEGEGEAQPENVGLCIFYVVSFL